MRMKVHKPRSDVAHVTRDDVECVRVPIACGRYVAVYLACRTRSRFSWAAFVAAVCGVGAT